MKKTLKEMLAFGSLLDDEDFDESHVFVGLSLLISFILLPITSICWLISKLCRRNKQ